MPCLSSLCGYAKLLDAFNLFQLAFMDRVIGDNCLFSSLGNSDGLNSVGQSYCRSPPSTLRLAYKPTFTLSKDLKFDPNVWANAALDNHHHTRRCTLFLEVLGIIPLSFHKCKGWALTNSSPHPDAYVITIDERRHSNTKTTSRCDRPGDCPCHGGSAPRLVRPTVVDRYVSSEARN